LKAAGKFKNSQLQPHCLSAHLMFLRHHLIINGNPEKA